MPSKSAQKAKARAKASNPPAAAASRTSETSEKTATSATSTPPPSESVREPDPDPDPDPDRDPRSWHCVAPALSPWVLDAVASMGFARMTPVQASAIPLFLGNKDVVVEAVTGSGKTLAFLVPLLERILRAPEPARPGHVAGIVISPTRELAAQTYSVLLSLLAFHGPSAPAAESAGGDGDGDGDVRSAGRDDEPPAPPAQKRIKPLLLLGGNVSPLQDVRSFLEHSPNLLIGTPGRLNELLASKHVHCAASSFEALVLDEADRLLDLGFKDTLGAIMARLPKQRRTGLFSATVSDAVVGGLVRAGLRNPVRVCVKVHQATAEQRTPASLELRYVLASPAQRLVWLQRLLSPAAARALFPSQSRPLRTIVYVSSCAAVDYFAALLAALLPGPAARGGGYALVPLHGKMAPAARRRWFAAFADAHAPTVLLTTDLAARGLDFPAVDLVVQFDPPTDPKVFLHRCGRAGRAGRRGLAVLFLSRGREEGYVDFLAVRKTPVSPLELPGGGGEGEGEGEGGLAADPSPEETAAAVARARSVVLKDRALCELGIRAFVSHVRAHSKHQTASIFRVQDIEWQSLVDCFALVRLPSMPELKKEGVEKRVVLGVDVDMATYAYKDKAREKQRLAQLANPTPASSSSPPNQKPPTTEERKKKNQPWSAKAEQQETKVARREKKRKRREAKMTPEERAREKEWREMVREVKRSRFGAGSDGEEDGGGGDGGGGGEIGGEGGGFFEGLE